MMTINIRGTTSFGGKVNLSATCNFLRHVKDSLRYHTDADRQNSAAISHPVSSRFATTCCVLQSEQRTLVGESGMIRT
jgi:hypothetical protein